MLYGWKDNLMLTNCLAACAHLSITVSRYSEIFVKKLAFYHTPLHSTPPLGGFPSEYRHPLWYGKTRMVSLPDGWKISKIYLFVLAQLTNVTDARTDRRTPGDGNSRAMHSIARQKRNECNLCYFNNEESLKIIVYCSLLLELHYALLTFSLTLLQCG